jgi:hypothetical protein
LRTGIPENRQDQIEYLIKELSETPHSRDAQALDRTVPNGLGVPGCQVVAGDAFHWMGLSWIRTEGNGEL